MRTIKPQPTEEISSTFLAKRGLPRDKANYVTALIRMRVEVRHLMRTARDQDVVAELLCLDEFIEDSVSTMYEAQKQKEGGAG